MPEERTYYVICEDNCKFESMTKEQIFAAIEEATGNVPTGIDDAFITKLKEQNSNVSLKMWLGTEAQYNALVTKASDTLYLIKNASGKIKVQDTEEFVEDIAEIETSIGNLASLTTTEKSNIVGAINEVDAEIGSLGAKFFSKSISADTTVTFTLANNTKLNIYTMGASTSQGEWIVNVTNGGAVTITPVKTASNITMSGSTNTISVANAGSTAYLNAIVFSGTIALNT